MDLSSLMFPLLLVLLAVPLFLSARKQKRAVAEQQALLTSLEPGDRVMTTSGLFATVADASDDSTIDLEIADGVVTTWLRQAIREKVVADTESDAVVDDVTDVDATADEPAADRVTVAEPVEHNTKK
ncbi:MULTISPECIES: preprotein translocase subunit YajC [Saccharothrix]|uniref:Preprotein translocase subunit YajC n=1 Tax=Saccharothrix yanglingensis TaxID=659496 RepID=A0ABU0WZ31_9PSEU|nr:MULTISPECIES: preprotein translocase subunit YajC [Saccharothrix]MBY8850024.1 preprotein translocase subunit YajC [Saccharothrix sp. MB29]MDQ2584324.1 preprotein translocase subunit YajC [Saccharothrix yanglingensis]MDU0290898.1 preprotein translocase subunit YajC [Saccharothrix longispora]